MSDIGKTVIGQAVPEPGPEPAVIEGVSRNGLGQLVVRVKGRPEPCVNARVARCFPWSLPGEYISIRDKDGKELVLFRTLADVDEAIRTALMEEMHDRIFTPRIRRVLDHSNEFGVISMTVETDRGNVKFQIRSRDDIRVLSEKRALFRDADGNVYEVHDLTELDAASRRCLGDYF